VLGELSQVLEIYTMIPPTPIIMDIVMKIMVKLFSVLASGTGAIDNSQDSLHDKAGKKEDIVEYFKSVVYSDWNTMSWKEEDKQLVIVTLSVKVNGM